jgi:hypothetical protein
MKLTPAMTTMENFCQAVVQKPTIAAAEEALEKEAGDANERDYATETSHKETPQRRLYDEDVEDEDRNNRARSTTLSMQCKSSGRKENGQSTVVNLNVPIHGMTKSESRRNQQEYHSVPKKSAI